MPISPIILQRRHAELGRIRLGAKRGGNGAPMKLEQFRFTTHSERYARDLATLYGGEARPWDNNGVASWEVFTDANSIPVIAVKGGLTQWMETWSGGGCAHRCDGERTTDGELCDPNDRNHVNAKPTTRLSVMLPELEAIGVWRMESHGWNAAAEIPAVAELAQYVGDLVPANLHLVERRAIKDGKTSRFVVPVLDLQIGTARLKEIVAQKSGAPVELEAPAGPAAIAAPETSAEPEVAAQAPALQMPSDADLDALDEPGLRKAWEWAANNRVLDEDGLRERITSRVAALRETSVAADPDGAVDAEIVEEADTPLPAGDPDPDVIWQQVLKTAADLRSWGLSELTADFTQAMGLIPDEASGAELAAYLHLLQTGEAA